MRSERCLIVYDREVHLEVAGAALVTGESIDVFRGNGLREGARMGTATVTGFENGDPVLSVHFDGIDEEDMYRFGFCGHEDRVD